MVCMWVYAQVYVCVWICVCVWVMVCVHVSVDVCVRVMMYGVDYHAAPVLVGLPRSTRSGGVNGLKLGEPGRCSWCVSLQPCQAIWMGLEEVASWVYPWLGSHQESRRGQRGRGSQAYMPSGEGVDGRVRKEVRLRGVEECGGRQEPRGGPSGSRLWALGAQGSELERWGAGGCSVGLDCVESAVLGNNKMWSVSREQSVSISNVGEMVPPSEGLKGFHHTALCCFPLNISSLRPRAQLDVPCRSTGSILMPCASVYPLNTICGVWRSLYKTFLWYL